jgi:hypothetical protein
LKREEESDDGLWWSLYFGPTILGMSFKIMDLLARQSPAYSNLKNKHKGNKNMQTTFFPSKIFLNIPDIRKNLPIETSPTIQSLPPSSMYVTVFFLLCSSMNGFLLQ